MKMQFINFLLVSFYSIVKAGFISLLPINDFSKKEFIDYNQVFNGTDKRFFTINKKYDLDVCECIDGVFLANDGTLIDYYARMTKDINVPYSRGFVYTSNNRLTKGFGTTI